MAKRGGSRRTIKRQKMRRPKGIGGYMTISLAQTKKGYITRVAGKNFKPHRTKREGIKDYNRTIKMYEKHGYKPVSPRTKKKSR